MKLPHLFVLISLLTSVACKQTATNEKEAAALADSVQSLIYSTDRPNSLHKAVQFADRSIELDNSRSLAYDSKATALIMLQKPDLALESLSAWLRKHPDDNEFMVKRGLIYEKLGKSSEAEKDFDSISKFLEARMPKITPTMTEKETGTAVTAAIGYFLIGRRDDASGILSKLQLAFPTDLKLKSAATEILQQDRNKLIYSIVGF